MRKTLIWIGLALVAAAPVAESQTADPAPGKSGTVAVVRDGPNPARDVAALVEGELKGLLPGTETTFVASPDLDAGWSVDGAEAALEAALADPEIDPVLATGALVTTRASAEAEAA